MSGEISRRTSLAWVALASASPWLKSQAAESAEAQPEAWQELALTPITAPGYGPDPNLKMPVVPWPLTLEPDQRASLRLLADLILPADDRSPSAGSLGLDAFIDEWVSAPYPEQQRDRLFILSGLAWLDAEALHRYGLDFRQASDAQRRAILETIAFRAQVRPGYERPARFFARLRGLMLAGFYSLPEGMADIGYLGNRPHPAPYPGPPREAIENLNASLAKLGLPPVTES